MIPSVNKAIFQSNVQSTQEIVELILDSNRNALLALDLKVIAPKQIMSYLQLNLIVFRYLLLLLGLEPALCSLDSLG